MQIKGRKLFYKYMIILYIKRNYSKKFKKDMLGEIITYALFKYSFISSFNCFANLSIELSCETKNIWKKKILFDEKFIHKLELCIFLFTLFAFFYKI
jgi:hypothetical protein